MNKKVLFRYLSITLIVCLMFQLMPFNASIARAATVTGKDGKTYDIPFANIQTIDVSTALVNNDVTINANANTAYVITGTSDVWNRYININSSTSTTATIYLLDLSVRAPINVTNNINIVVCGTVNNYDPYGFIVPNTGGANSQCSLYIRGYDKTSTVKSTNSLFYPNSYYKDVTISSLTMNYNKYFSDGLLSNKLTLDNCVINGTQNIASSKKVLTKSSNYNYTTLDINNCDITNLYISINDATTSTPSSTSIKDSNIETLILSSSKNYSVPPTVTVNNSDIDCLKFDYDTSASTMYTGKLSFDESRVGNIMSTLPSYLINYQINGIELNSSTVAFLSNSFYDASKVGYPSPILNYSSFNYAIANKVVTPTPKNSAGSNVYLKIIQVPGFANKNILVKYEDGQVSKLHTDQEECLYLYLPSGSKKVNLQVTDESWTENLGEYELSFNPITTDDNTINVAQPVKTENPGSEELKIIAQSSNKEIIVGYSTDLFVAGNAEDIVYKWSKDGVELEGELNPIFHINPTVTGSAIYTCTLTREDKTLESQPITVTVVDNPLASEVADLNQITTDLTNQITALTGELESANSEKTALQERVSDLENQITSLNGQVSELQNQIGTLEQELQDSQGENQSLKQAIQDLNGQINSLNGQIESLQGDLQLVNEQKSSLELTVIDLNNEINNLNGQISLLEGKLSASEGENTGLREQVSGLQDTITQLQDNITNLNSQVASLTEQNSALHTQLDTANNTIQSLQDQVTALLQENASLKDQLSYAQEQIDELTDELTAEQQKNEDLQTQLNNALSQINEIATQLGSPTVDRQDILDQINAMKNEISSLNNQLQESNDSITRLNIQIQNLIESATGLQHKIDVAMDSLTEYEGAELQDKINTIINENKSLSGQITDLENQNNALINQIASMNDTISSLLMQIGELTDENTNLKDQLNQAEETINSLQEQLTAQINTNNDLQGKLSDLVSQMDDLQSQLSTANADKAELLNQIDNLQSEIGTLTQQLLESNDKIDSLNQQIVSMNATINELTDQVNDALDGLSEYEGNNLKEKIGDIKEKQAGLKNALEDANNRNTILNTQLSDATGQLSYLQSEIDRLTGVLQDKDAEIARLNALLKQKNDDNAALIAGNADLERKNQNLQKENEQLREQINQGNPGNSDELQKVRAQLTEKEKELATANATIDSLKKQLANKSSGNTTNGTVVKDDEYVVVPETSSNNNLNEIVKEPVINNTTQTVIESKDGWELASSLTANADWGDTVSPAQDASYTGVFTFFDNGLSSSKQTLSNKSTGKTNLLSLMIPGVGVGSQEKQLVKDSMTGNYAKYTFYARRLTEKNKIYVCEVNVPESKYISPVTSLTSSIMNEPRNFTPNNKYTKAVDGNIVFRVSADYGDVGKGSVKYQVVPENQDFDSDGKWTEVTGDTFTVKKQKENFRVYVKYTDKAGNFTVDKTVGFQVAKKEKSPSKQITKPVTQKKIPVFTIQKTIELGHTYTINMANISNKETIKFSSDNQDIATVNKKGVITSKRVGNAIISGVVTAGNNAYKFIVKVNVVKGVYDNTLNLKPITSLDFSSGKPTLIVYKLCKKDESFRLDILDSKDAKITYKSTDGKVATVGKTGIVKGIGKGRANIYVTVTKDGIAYNYMIIVRVDDGSKDETMWDYLKEE